MQVITVVTLVLWAIAASAEPASNSCQGKSYVPDYPNMNERMTLRADLVGVAENWNTVCKPGYAIVPIEWAVGSRRSGILVRQVRCIPCCELKCEVCNTTARFPGPVAVPGEIAYDDEERFGKVDAILDFFVQGDKFGCHKCKDNVAPVTVESVKVKTETAANVIAGEPETQDSYTVSVYGCPNDPSPTVDYTAKPPVEKNTGNATAPSSGDTTDTAGMDVTTGGEDATPPISLEINNTVSNGKNETAETPSDASTTKPGGATDTPQTSNSSAGRDWGKMGVWVGFLAVVIVF